MFQKTSTDEQNEPMPQLLMPLVTDANRVQARAGSPNWDASDDVMYDMMIMLSGKNIDDVMPVLMSMVATNIALIAPDLASAVRGRGLGRGARRACAREG